MLINDMGTAQRNPLIVMLNFTTPIILEPRFSKRLAFILFVLHSGALVILLSLNLPWLAKLDLGLLVLTSLYYMSQRHLLFINHPLYGCFIYYDDIHKCLKVELKSKETTELTNNSYGHSQLIIMQVKGHWEIFIILADAIDEEIFRQLRVYLQHAHFQCQNGGERRKLSTSRWDG